MDFSFIDLFLNIDDSLAGMAHELGWLIYALLFLIIFCETGFLVTPFLPGDSLLFISGALAGTGILNLPILIFVLFTAAVLGDTVNFWIGRYAGNALINGRFSALIKGEWIEHTRTFYSKYGGLTIIVARFVPYVRTFAPFLAGVGEMHYPRFLLYNLIGGALWTFGFVIGGYLLGNIPVIREHVTLLMWFVLFLCLFAIGMVIKALILGIVKKKEEKFP